MEPQEHVPSTGLDQEAGHPQDSGVAEHEVQRAVTRLNNWFGDHWHHVPACFNWSRFRRERHVPTFKAVSTSAIKGWRAEDLKRLFRVVPGEARRTEGGVEIPVELLVADKSVDGSYLDVQELMNTAFGVIAGQHLLGRHSPRLWWFWLHWPSLIEEMGSYVNGIRLRVDAATPVQHDQRRVFEEFGLPLEHGQRTAIGKGCFFVLEYAQPQGAVPYWRFNITRDDEVVVGPQVLQTKPIYLEDQLLAVIRKISEDTVTLSVLTSEGGRS